MQNKDLTAKSEEKIFTAADFSRRVQLKLSKQLSTKHNDLSSKTISRAEEKNILGDHTLNAEKQSEVRLTPPKHKAAVLIPVIERTSGTSLILTQRSNDLRHHAGQISFPGGKVDKTDNHITDAALREAKEEIGLEPAKADVLGFLDPYYTATGFYIVPVVAVISPDFVAEANPDEVQEVFEVPLEFLMSEDNHHRHSLVWQGHVRYYHAMPYENYYIWGATAGIIHNLYERLYRP